MKIVWTTAAMAALMFLADISHAFVVVGSSCISRQCRHPPDGHASVGVRAITPLLFQQQQYQQQQQAVVVVAGWNGHQYLATRSSTTSSSSSSALWGGMSNYDGSTDGTNVAPYLLGMALAICVWLFTIPVEFRRARFCSEEDAIRYPTVCTTPAIWSQGISSYYANGGGIQFDFSVEKEGNPWVGGTFREEGDALE